MDDVRLERIENKLDATNTHLAAIDVTLAKTQADVNYHIKRTDILEEQVKPIKQHTDELKAMVRILKILALLASVVEGLHMWKW